jgi:hypothetical protein
MRFGPRPFLRRPGLAPNLKQGRSLSNRNQGAFVKTVYASAVFALLSALALHARPAFPAQPSRPLAPVTQVYVPKGFDSNDDSQVVVAGYLPDLCHKAPRSEVKVEGSTIHVTIRALLDGSAAVCPQVIVPFLEAVSVGPLEKGTYDVRVNEGSGRGASGAITVVEAPGLTVDDHIYANVDAIERVPGSRRILLKGYNPSDCLVFDRVEFISNGKDAYSVLPVMRQERESCPMKLAPFAIEAMVPDSLGPDSPKADEALLHVRVMDGRSVNALLQRSGKRSLATIGR